MKRMLRMHEVRRGRMKSKALPCMKFMLLLHITNARKGVGASCEQSERFVQICDLRFMRPVDSLHAAMPHFINFALKTAVTVQRKAQ